MKTRAQQIVEQLRLHNAQAPVIFKTDAYREQQFFFPDRAGMLMLREYEGGFLEVLHVTDQICAGSTSDPPHRVPDMQFVLDWIEKLFSVKTASVGGQ